jgi:hypothetical protein
MSMSSTFKQCVTINIDIYTTVYLLFRLKRNCIKARSFLFIPLTFVTVIDVARSSRPNLFINYFQNFQTKVTNVEKSIPFIFENIWKQLKIMWIIYEFHLYRYYRYLTKHLLAHWQPQLP